MNPYRPTATDDHEREEELQWARILERGDPAAGMLLVFSQKMCTSFHELEPATAASAVKPEKRDFFRARMAARIQRVLDVVEKNGLSGLDGIEDLRAVLEAATSAESVEALADLAERVHGLGHRLCDALERAGGSA